MSDNPQSQHLFFHIDVDAMESRVKGFLETFYRDPQKDSDQNAQQLKHITEFVHEIAQIFHNPPKQIKVLVIATTPGIGSSSAINQLLHVQNDVCPTRSASDATTRHPITLSHNGSSTNDTVLPATLTATLLSDKEVSNLICLRAERLSSSHGTHNYHDRREETKKWLRNLTKLAMPDNPVSEQLLDDCLDSCLQDRLTGDILFAQKSKTWAACALERIKHLQIEADSNVVETCSDFEELGASISRLTAGPSQAILKALHISLSTVVLEHGLVLVDCPSGYDGDSMTALVSEPSMKGADVRMICGKAGDCLVNEPFKDEVRRSIEAVGHDNTWILLLRIDVRQQVPSFAAANQKQDLAGEESEVVSQLEKYDTDEVRQVLAAYYDNNLATVLRRLELEGNMGDLPVRVAFAQHLNKILARVSIGYQCRAIRSELEKSFSDPITGKEPKIFFLSSHQYYQNTIDHLVRDAPVLDAHSTGIPRLRTCLRELPGIAQHRALGKHMRLKVPPFYQVFCRVFSSVGRSHVIPLVRNILNELAMQIPGLQDFCLPEGGSAYTPSPDWSKSMWSRMEMHIATWSSSHTLSAADDEEVFLNCFSRWLRDLGEDVEAGGAKETWLNHEFFAKIIERKHSI